MSTLAAAKSFSPLSVEYSLRYCLSSAREMSLHSAGTEGIAGAPAAGGAAVPGAFAGAAVPGAATAGAAAAPVSAGVPAAGDTSGMAPFAAKRAVSRASEAVFFLHPPHTYRHLPTYCGALWGGQNRTYLPIA